MTKAQQEKALDLLRGLTCSGMERRRPKVQIEEEARDFLRSI